LFHLKACTWMWKGGLLLRLLLTYQSFTPFFLMSKDHNFLKLISTVMYLRAESAMHQTLTTKGGFSHTKRSRGSLHVCEINFVVSFIIILYNIYYVYCDDIYDILHLNYNLTSRCDTNCATFSCIDHLPFGFCETQST
jgi:hypothetical protein